MSMSDRRSEFELELAALIEEYGHLIDHAPEEAGDMGFLISWVVVAEWSDTNGRKWASSMMPEQQPPWITEGLLYHTMQHVARSYS